VRYTSSPKLVIWIGTSIMNLVTNRFNFRNHHANHWFLLSIRARPPEYAMDSHLVTLTRIEQTASRKCTLHFRNTATCIKKTSGAFGSLMDLYTSIRGLNLQQTTSLQQQPPERKLCGSQLASKKTKILLLLCP
jgi:hypothetical protein